MVTWFSPSQGTQHGGHLVFLLPKDTTLFFINLLCVCVCVCYNQMAICFPPPKELHWVATSCIPPKWHNLFFFHSLCFLFLTTKWPPNSPWDKHWATRFSSLPKRLFFSPQNNLNIRIGYLPEFSPPKDKCFLGKIKIRKQPNFLSCQKGKKFKNTFVMYL